MKISSRPDSMVSLAAFLRTNRSIVLGAAIIALTSFAAEHDKGIQYTPEECIARLKNGNLRFAEGKAKRPRADASRRVETVNGGQHPIAVVIACADSREPVELIFDQGIGDVFVIRVAGNVCNTDEIGSAEYATEHLGVPVCVVLGHTHCGAVTAAVTNAELHSHVGALVNGIKPAVALAQKEHPELKDKELVPAATEANIRQSIRNLQAHSPIINRLVASGKLRIEGGVYDLENGQIVWLDSPLGRRASSASPGAPTGAENSLPATQKR